MQEENEKYLNILYGIETENKKYFLQGMKR